MRLGDWHGGLTEEEQDALEAAVNLLISDGPDLGRSLVDRIKGSRFQHMKESRPLNTHLRILFAFDPRRYAILLLGGNKKGRWKDWYKQAIPQAAALYEEHLRILEKEGLL